MQPPSEPETEQTAKLLIVGDVANCHNGNSRHRETSDLVASLPGTIALVGDIAYPNGTIQNFRECFHLAWGKHKERIKPVPGNHEYHTEGAAGYFEYFGAAASPLEPDCILDCKGFYSYNLGDWHVVALNSARAMASGTEQERWLRADLAAHEKDCTLAYWHTPRFSSGSHGNNPYSADVWGTLYEYGVDVVVNGHDHNYERFAPQNPHGEIDEERGIRQFVVGTGGAVLKNFSRDEENSEARNNQVWGVLQLSLYPGRYEWEFKPIAGQEYIERGSNPCVVIGSTQKKWVKQNYIPVLFDK